MQDNEIVEPDNIEDDTSLENIEKIGGIIEKIEFAKQKTALKQIEATDRDNERQYNFALKQEDNNYKKWKTSFIIGTISATVLGLSGLYMLIFQNRADIGIGLLSTTISGVFGYIAGAGNCK